MLSANSRINKIRHFINFSNSDQQYLNEIGNTIKMFSVAFILSKDLSNMKL